MVLFQIFDCTKTRKKFVIDVSMTLLFLLLTLNPYVHILLSIVFFLVEFFVKTEFY